MRTKTLLLTAALGALAASTASAQVYSVNAVGYINVSVKPGFNLIANQLNQGTGNNTVDKIFAGVPDGTVLYKFVNGTYVIDGYDSASGGWDDGTLTLKPGEGIWVRNPGAAAFTVTFVGEVPQGSLTNPIPVGFSIVSSIVPQSADLDAGLKYPVADGDSFYFFRNGAYVIYGYDSTSGGWDPAAPVPAVGESFWARSVAAKNWVRDFSVNQ